jgi:peptide/nickel transport system permease protein
VVGPAAYCGGDATRMVRYALRRLVEAVPVVLLVILIVFCLFRVIPGDPARLAAGKTATPERVKEVRREMGLDKPLPAQYILYIGSILRGDFGRSIYTRRPVIDDLALYAPATLELCLLGLLGALVLGIPFGVLAAAKENRWPDHLTRLLALSGVSLPVFWLGLLLQVVFYFRLGWLPGSGRLSPLIEIPRHVTGMFILDSLLTGSWQALADGIRHAILPVFCLSFVMMGYISRMTRSSMLEVLHQDYVQAARAKGLRETGVLAKHALRNALIPVVTVAGTLFAEILCGVVLTETIFSWKGLGSYLVESLLGLDLQPVAAFAVLSALAYVLINLLVDLLYGVIDPKIRD